MGGHHLAGRAATAAVSPVTPADPPTAGGKEGPGKHAGGFSVEAGSGGARDAAERSQELSRADSSSATAAPGVASAAHGDRGVQLAAVAPGPTLEDIAAAVDSAVAARLDSVLAAIRQAHVESVKQAHTTRNTFLSRIQQQNEEISELRTAVASLQASLAEATRAF